MTLNTSSTEFRKILKYQMKICPVNAELFHVDRRTDRGTYDETKIAQIISPCYSFHKDDNI